ncbi:delta-type opioid receptor-like isoform X1 [Salvelinus fontinalis]|uniref:delta-type opioid receptor-like isoform X1 n=1 Tax=Salvelinus fontinalis TaxID=8038 RepID=UPI0024857FBB|nr:delta-type opioid receptor-like isoform X1 [Salvelinus fontinalis]
MRSDQCFHTFLVCSRALNKICIWGVRRHLHYRKGKDITDFDYNEVLSARLILHLNTMEFPTLSAADLADLYSVITFNATLPEDSTGLPSRDNDTEKGSSKDTTSIIIAVSITALYSVICIVGLLGNILVMYGVVRYTKMKTATNIYIFNLALADALATSTLPFQSAKYLMNTWPFGEFLCKVILAVDYYNMFTSIFTLTMMSVDRYIAVCHPVRALDFRTSAKAKMINVCIWILSSAIGVPIMVMAVTKVTDKGNTGCMLQFPQPDWYWDMVTKICVFVFAFVVPVLVITICYGLMILRLKNVRLLSGSKEKDRNMRRITHMVLVVVAVFIICWTPIHIFIILRTMVQINSTNPYVIASWHLCIALGYMNSSLNPLLYAFLDGNFKRCFRDFCLPFRSNMDQSSFSRARNSTREPTTVCPPRVLVRKPV